MFLTLESFIFIWVAIFIIALPIWLYLKIKKENTGFKIILGIATGIAAALSILSIVVYAILKALKIT